MLTQTIKRVKLKGKISPVIREQYLRNDLSCYSPLCNECIKDEKNANLIQLNSEAGHYAIPCIDIIQKYLEILELQDIKGLILLQSIISKMLLTHGHRIYHRLRAICKDIRRGCVTFLNENCQNTSVLRTISDSFNTWLIKCCINTAEFYASHLKGAISIVLITDNVQEYESLTKHEGVRILPLKSYLQLFWGNISSALELYDSLSLALSTSSVKDLSKSYNKYLQNDVLQAGIKSGRYFTGYLRVNKHNAQEEAFVTSSRATSKDAGDVYIFGMKDRNRAIHGDEVVIEILPRDQWKSRCLKLVDNPYDSKDGNTEQADLSSVILSTGRVVGVLERNWRNYVTTLPEEEEANSSIKNRETILVVPYDYRIPKIRVATKQAENIRNQRILVRIDNWEIDSQYPNGHFVQALGEIGNLETEIKTLLIEHNIFVGDFPQNLISELPVCTEDNPWTVDEAEVQKRRDLRNTHLIFSIDPKGCEDVDDTLSVRKLPNGMLELGVHIADVTYFVRELSLVDLEARSRSTSVYLPDRRYDMLPHVLSGNLCSLLGNVDRYAVSVLWEMNENGQVQNVWYGRTIIKSKYKLCYEAAQEILCGASCAEMVSEISELQGLSADDTNFRFSELKSSIFMLYNIANNIRKERLRAGGLELNSINMKFEIDRSLPSVIANIKAAKELAIHKTVAECMIYANHWVAKKISDTFPNLAVLRRHPDPREADLAELQKLALSKGFHINILSNKDLAKSLEEAVDSQDPSINQILRILATQTMNQATYCCTGSFSEGEWYHYGLGLKKYTHFTSPIRRYADVIVHRLLLAAVGESDLASKRDTADIEEFCSHMNMKHKAAQDLEKDAQQLFLSHYFEDLISQSKCITVDAIIYSLRANGMLVFIPKYGLKGAICLLNKEKKVAVVRDAVEWMDGHLKCKENSLIVEAGGTIQTYKIFNHVTACVKVQNSRSHQRKIILDLVNNRPYVSDWEEPSKTIDVTTSLGATHEEINTSEIEDISNTVQKTDEFDMYLYLRKMKALTLADKTNLL